MSSTRLPRAPAPGAATNLGFRLKAGRRGSSRAQVLAEVPLVPARLHPLPPCEFPWPLGPGLAGISELHTGASLAWQSQVQRVSIRVLSTSGWA